MNFLKKLLPNAVKKIISMYLRIFDVFCMMIMLQIYPEKTYKFSTRKALPPKKFRMKKYENNEIPYKFFTEKSSSIVKIDEVNVIGIGESFDLNNINKINKPTYLVSYWNSLQINENKQITYNTKENGEIFDFWDSNKVIGHNKNIQKNNKYIDFVNPNITYVVTNPQLVKNLIDRGHNVLVVNTYRKGRNGELTTDNKDKEKILDIYKKKITRIAVIDEIMKFPTEKPYLSWTQVGSFISCLAAVSFLAQKINVYGWDFFLKDSPEKFSHLKLISKMYPSYKIDLGRSKTHFEEAMFNFYFGYQFSQNPRFNIYSPMGKLINHQNLIKKIEKALFL
tara:strand:- start:10849 stop:11859 length:1011 start_codon:yes stop_codon:yes gene_type:complete